MNIRRAVTVGAMLACVAVSTSRSHAASVDGASCSHGDVQAAIDGAITGDVVIVPAGNCAWGSSWIRIPDSKKLVIRGAGIGATTITGSGSFIFDMGRSGSRITGFTFITGEGGPVKVDGVGWRIDHCEFRSDADVWREGINVRGTQPTVHPEGVIDHCVFWNTRVTVTGDANLLAHPLWAAPLSLGSSQATFIEDCEFTYTVHANAIDTNYGGRYVFRHNVVNDGYLEAHSVQGVHRTTRSWEIYGNQINQVNRPMWVPFFLRGGTGIIFDNIVSGIWTKPRIALDNVRSCPDGRNMPQGWCNGGSEWDGNQPLETGGVGNHEGANGAAALVDSSSNWEPESLVGIYVYNLSDGSKGEITANTETTITATLSGGTANSWGSGDDYKITDGYPCRDQAGQSTDGFLWTAQSPNPPQATEPAYAWNNYLGSNEVTFDSRGCDQSIRHIQPLRDFFDSRQKPGYTPYPYPHPLTQGPLAPTNLRLRLDP